MPDHSIKIPRPVPELLGEAKVYVVPSASRGGHKHYITVFNNQNGVQCSCEGFQFSGHCWHVEAVPWP